MRVTKKTLEPSTFQTGCFPYLQTGVVLAGLVPDDGSRYTLFDDITKIEK